MATAAESNFSWCDCTGVHNVQCLTGFKFYIRGQHSATPDLKYELLAIFDLMKLDFDSNPWTPDLVSEILHTLFLGFDKTVPHSYLTSNPVITKFVQEYDIVYESFTNYLKDYNSKHVNAKSMNLINNSNSTENDKIDDIKSNNGVKINPSNKI